MTSSRTLCSSAVVEALRRARRPSTRVPEVVPAVDPRPVWSPSSDVGPAPDARIGQVLRAALTCLPGAAALRPSASAGGRHPIDVLVHHRGLMRTLDPRSGDLLTVGSTPVNSEDGAVIVLGVTASRTVGKYGDRALPSLLLDVGHVLATLAVSAGSAGLTFAVDLDGEVPVPQTHLEPGWYPLATGRVGASVPVPGRPRVRRPAGAELITRALTELEPTGPPAWGLLAAPQGVSATALTERRSTFPPWSGNVPETTLAHLVDVLTPRPWVVRADGLTDPTSARARGDARPTLARWSCGQDWVAQAPVLLVWSGPRSLVEPASVEADGLRAVRRAYLRWGVAAQFALLLATASGLRSRAVGCWWDADLGACVGRPPGDELVAHAVALGGPPERAATRPSS